MRSHQRREILSDVLYRLAEECSYDANGKGRSPLTIMHGLYDDFQEAATPADHEALAIMRKALAAYQIPVSALQIVGGGDA